MSKELLPLEALKETAIQIVEALYGKEEPLRNNKINELLETKQFKIIETALIEQLLYKQDYERVMNEKNSLLEEYKKNQNKLKALEIIKKYINIRESYDELFPYEIVDKQYISNSSELLISKEEYNLLKEVLQNDN